MEIDMWGLLFILTAILFGLFWCIDYHKTMMEDDECCNGDCNQGRNCPRRK